ncbi:darcynin family protein [Amycolatopsis magusensis]|uniref:darcynin family protein n=1 Tax=Amycolatopsis magusensis TaxID=882444 RepID=UPI0034D7763B
MFHDAFQLVVEALRETPFWDHYFEIVEIQANRDSPPALECQGRRVRPRRLAGCPAPVSAEDFHGDPVAGVVDHLPQRLVHVVAARRDEAIAVL